MGAYSVPVQVTCADSTISLQGPGVGTPTLTMGLKINVPLSDLIKTLAQFQGLAAEAPIAPKSLPFLAPEDPEEVVFSAAIAQIEVAKKEEEENMIGSAAWEVVPKPLTLTETESKCHGIKILNLLKGLRTRDIEHILGTTVGPVSKCNVSECVALVTFTQVEHAQCAVQKYDGGILEVKTESSKEDPDRIRLTPVPWHANGPVLQQMLEEHIGSLQQCHFRRGENWLTMAQVNKVPPEFTKAGNSEKPEYKVNFKGSIIKVVFDAQVG
eukprot:TRINITY_DN19987_c0_g1_i2.p1 TRINITY_DN19987_c0_g1~~TRINITY_DN19987_c0_g1_i2.p1  ORF type:complete len:269 (-),score=44.08 TRINITY_DN19987_c0_g1_i2:53-859(-)